MSDPIGPGVAARTSRCSATPRSTATGTALRRRERYVTAPPSRIHVSSCSATPYAYQGAQSRAVANRLRGRDRSAPVDLDIGGPAECTDEPDRGVAEIGQDTRDRSKGEEI